MPVSFVSRRILLVEDDEELRYAYAAHLTSSGFMVEEAGDLAAAHKNFAATRLTLRFLIFACPTVRPSISFLSSRN